jgi:hypothetical protein
VALDNSQNKSLSMVNTSDASDNSRTLLLQIKENMATAIVPKLSPSNDNDHHFLFMKLEEDLQSQMILIGVFTGSLEYGRVTVKVKNANVLK